MARRPASTMLYEEKGQEDAQQGIHRVGEAEVQEHDRGGGQDVVDEAEPVVTRSAPSTAAPMARSLIAAIRRLIAAIALAPADWVPIAPCWMSVSACTGAARSGDHEAPNPNTSQTTMAAT